MPLWHIYISKLKCRLMCTAPLKYMNKYINRQINKYDWPSEDFPVVCIGLLFIMPMRTYDGFSLCASYHLSIIYICVFLLKGSAGADPRSLWEEDRLHSGHIIPSQDQIFLKKTHTHSHYELDRHFWTERRKHKQTQYIESIETSEIVFSEATALLVFITEIYHMYLFRISRFPIWDNSF